VRACACICVCLGMHERVCFVVVCPGIHRLFAGNAEGVVFVCIYIVLTSSLHKCTIYILFFYVFYMFFSIQKELKVTAPRKVFLRW